MRIDPINSDIAELLRRQEEKQLKLVKAAETGLFPIGTEVVCDCEQGCANKGKVVDYNFADMEYVLEHGIALFGYARKLTKLEKALK